MSELQVRVSAFADAIMTDWPPKSQSLGSNCNHALQKNFTLRKSFTLLLQVCYLLNLSRMLVQMKRQELRHKARQRAAHDQNPETKKKAWTDKCKPSCWKSMVDNGQLLNAHPMLSPWHFHEVDLPISAVLQSSSQFYFCPYQAVARKRSEFSLLSKAHGQEPSSKLSSVDRSCPISTH